MFLVEGNIPMPAETREIAQRNCHKCVQHVKSIHSGWGNDYTMMVQNDLQFVTANENCALLPSIRVTFANPNIAIAFYTTNCSVCEMFSNNTALHNYHVSPPGYFLINNFSLQFLNTLFLLANGRKVLCINNSRGTSNLRQS